MNNKNMMDFVVKEAKKCMNAVTVYYDGCVAKINNQVPNKTPSRKSTRKSTGD